MAYFRSRNKHTYREMLLGHLRGRESGDRRAGGLVKGAAYALPSLHPSTFYELNVGTQAVFVKFASDGNMLVYISSRRTVTALRTCLLPEVDQAWSVTPLASAQMLLSTSFAHDFGDVLLLGSFKRGLVRPNGLLRLAGLAGSPAETSLHALRLTDGTALGSCRIVGCCLDLSSLASVALDESGASIAVVVSSSCLVALHLDRAGRFSLTNVVQCGFEDSPPVVEEERDGASITITLRPENRSKGMLPVFTQRMLARAWRDTRNDLELFYGAVYTYLASLRFDLIAWIDTHVVLMRLSPPGRRDRGAEPVFATFDILAERVISIHIDSETDQEFSREFLSTALRLIDAPLLGSAALDHALRVGGEMMRDESLTVTRAYEVLPSPKVLTSFREQLANRDLFSIFELGDDPGAPLVLRWVARAPNRASFVVDLRMLGVDSDGGSSDDDDQFGFASASHRLLVHPHLGILVVTAHRSLAGPSHFVFI